jgi:DNA-binding GntR family transcriptional regulator
LALKALEKAGLIGRRRGKITIIDRRVLEKRSNGTYVPTED